MLSWRAVLSTRQGISLDLLLITYIERTWFDRRAGHFCRPPYVAIGSGPSLHLDLSRGGWRMVSEDSRAKARVFPADFPAWRLVRHPPSDCYCSCPINTSRDRQEWASTGWMHRVFQHIANCTHHRRRWEGQPPFASRGFPFTLGILVTAHSSVSGQVISA